MSGKAKAGISLYTYGADILSGRMTVKDCIDHAASLGVKGVELVDKQHIPNYPHQSVYDLQNIRDYIESYGMVVSCYSTYVDVMVKYDHWATREEQIEIILKDIYEAKVLGVKVFRPAYLATSREVLKEKNVYDLTAKNIKQVVMQLLPTLKKQGLKWGIEIHAPMPPAVYINLVKEVNSEYFGLVPDFSAWQTKGLPTEYGMSSLDLLRGAMSHAVHVHAKAHNFDEKGEEVGAPYDKLIPIIKESGFDGYISAEYEGWILQPNVDSKKIAKTHINLIRKYL